jgi:hypothetical protein
VGVTTNSLAEFESNVSVLIGIGEILKKDDLTNKRTIKCGRTQGYRF